jgi:hypothetical protein
MRLWPQMIDKMFWPFAVKAIAERMNSITININGETPESKFYGVPLETIPVKSFHTMFCPCYVWTVDYKLRVPLDRLNGNQGQTYKFTWGTHHFMLVVWRLSTIRPQETSPHNFMSYSTMILQLFPVWRLELSHQIGKLW